MFDPQTMKWTDIGISVKSPKSLFIDLNGCMTLQVGKKYEPRAFYRIALRFDSIVI